MPASSDSHPSIGKEDGEECVFKGETCQKSGGFHQLEWCAQEEREGVWESGIVDLALCLSSSLSLLA